MEMKLPNLRVEERLALALRALYEDSGYKPFHMGSFEEYDFYMQNKPFLTGEDIITFTSADGRLMALKPDVTLSIVKSTAAGQVRRAYYNEMVYRRSRHTGEYREIRQVGLEYIGGDAMPSEQEVLCLAGQSLSLMGVAAMDLSHMEFIEAILAPFSAGKAREAAINALKNKSPHGMEQAAISAGLSEKIAQTLKQIAVLSGEFSEAMSCVQELAKEIEGAQKPLGELQQLYDTLREKLPKLTVRLDFSILSDVDYYNGVIFRGFVQGVPGAVLTGGRYDNLMRRFEKPQTAIGFAVYLDDLATKTGEDAMPAQKDNCEAQKSAQWLNVALPKGRLGNKVYKLFESLGYTCPEVLQESRKLVFENEDAKVRYFLVKPGDVDIYVEHGAADIGVVGKDVLLESGADVLELLDLKLGACVLAVAGPVNYAEDMSKPLRVATKYPAVTRKYYAEQSRSVEIIKLHGSIELAPILGLSDVIVDIVETGSTLKENNLAVLQNVEPSSARLIANKSAWRFKQQEISELTRKLGEIV